MPRKPSKPVHAERPVKQRMTRQRRVVLETVHEIMNHPSVDAVYERVRRRLPRVSLATVYRNLEVLAGQGQLLKIESAGHRMRFDHNTHRHHHVVCVECGRVDDVHDACVAVKESLVDEEVSGFEILDWRVEFRGVCPACQNARRKSA